MLGGTSPFIKTAFPKMAARVIKNRRIRLFPEDPDLSERSLVFPNTGLKQRLCLLKTLTRPTRMFTFLPCLSCLWVVVVYASCTFFSLVVDSAGKEVARKTHLLFSFIASEVSCSDYLLFVRLLGGSFCFLFCFDDNHHCICK